MPGHQASALGGGHLRGSVRVPSGPITSQCLPRGDSIRVRFGDGAADTAGSGVLEQACAREKPNSVHLLTSRSVISWW